MQADEPAVVMHTAGGRRKRLGVGGKAVQVSRVRLPGGAVVPDVPDSIVW